MLGIFTFRTGRALRAIALVIATAGLLVACQGYGGDAAGTSADAASSGRQSPSFQMPIRVNGQYALIDQDARLVLPFGSSKYDVAEASRRFLATDPTILVKREGQWQLVDRKTQALVKTVGKNIYSAGNPDYFGFKQDGKIGLMDSHGNVIQSPRFDSISLGYSAVDGESSGVSFIRFKVGDKYGALDTHGKQLTDAVYDAIPLFYVPGNLLIAKKGKQNWLINLGDGSQQPVPYSEPSNATTDSDDGTEVPFYDAFAMSDGHMVVVSAADPDPDTYGSKYGLVDSQGRLVVPMNYARLGTPSNGLVAFWQEARSLCGYMDYQGKVMIPARFDDCKPFGKKSALAAVLADARGNYDKYGLIDRTGAWLMQPTYDKVGNAEWGSTKKIWLNSEDSMGYVRGYNVVYRTADAEGHYVGGIVDLDQGRELFAPTYAAIGLITPQRFAFTRKIVWAKDGTGEYSNVRVGLMDITGKALIPSGRYIDFLPDSSGRMLAFAANRTRALFDPKGRMLIAPQWKLSIRTGLGAVFGYSAGYIREDHYIRATYDLQGKPLFVIKYNECGAEQLQDGNGKVIWPQDPTLYCGRKDKDDDDEDKDDADKGGKEDDF